MKNGRYGGNESVKKKGRHDGGFRFIPKMTREEWWMEICLWLGGALGLAFGVIYLKRNPQELSVRRPGKAAAAVMWWYTMCGMGGGYCVYMALSWIWERIRRRIRRRD